MDVWALLKQQKLTPLSLEPAGSGYCATFEAGQYDAVRRCWQRLYKATLEGKAVALWITRYGRDLQQDTAYMVFEVNDDQK